MKIAICGHGRAGKDVAAEWLDANTRLRYSISTSQVIVPFAAKKLGLSEAEMYRRRHEFRQVMFETGVEIRKDDPAYLARTVLKTGDIVVGVRDLPEMQTVRRERLVDLAIWVDRPGTPPDPTLHYGPELCDVVLVNAWGLPELHERLANLARTWGVMRSA